MKRNAEDAESGEEDAEVSDEGVWRVFVAVLALGVALAGEDFSEALVFHEPLVAGVAEFQGDELGLDDGRQGHGVRLHGDVERNGKWRES